MKRFIEGEERSQVTLLPECLDDYIAEDNPIRVVDVFVDELQLHALGFEGTGPAATGRPSYHPAVLLKVYIYGYLNRLQSSRRLEREAQRNVERMWLTGRLAPDFKTIADFRKDHGEAIRKVCREFVLLCRRLKLFTDGIVGQNQAHLGPHSRKRPGEEVRRPHPTLQRSEHVLDGLPAKAHRLRRRSPRSRSRCRGLARSRSRCAPQRINRSR
jgi:transposase